MTARPEPTSPRSPLSRERVLGAAIELADRDGIDSLSMRRLARALGVEAMSLYHYVARKDDLLDGIADLVVGEFELPARDGPWQAAIRGSAISAHGVLLRHPWACSLMMSPARVRPARLRYMDALMGRLRDAGFSAGLTDLAYHALDSHILGFTLWLAGYSAGAAAVPDYGPAFLRELSLDDYPNLAEHVRWHLQPSAPGAVSEFAFSLDLILEGLERIRART
jgi:AcrR family transcriptional regulator